MNKYNTKYGVVKLDAAAAAVERKFAVCQCDDTLSSMCKFRSMEKQNTWLKSAQNIRHCHRLFKKQILLTI